MAFLEALVRIALGVPLAAIPDHHRAAAILALRDGTLEVVVFDRMILDLHRQPLLAGDQAWSASDGPALHYAVELEPQVVVEAAGGVLLDDELVALAARLRAARLRCHVELAFAVVDLKTHDRLASHCKLKEKRIKRPAGTRNFTVRSTHPSVLLPVFGFPRRAIRIARGAV